jgi:hypothetical protein
MHAAIKSFEWDALLPNHPRKERADLVRHIEPISGPGNTMPMDAAAL